MSRKSAPSSVLITGASSGLGGALARAYAAPGVFLALSGRNRQRLEATAEACRRAGSEVETALVDVTDRTAMKEWIEETDAAHPLDLVIANAGISSGSGGSGESEDQVRDIFAVNLAGVLNTVLPVMPLMQDRRRGQIALMSSLAGLRGLPSAPAYAASKAAVKSYGEGLTGLLAADGIRVSVVCPGFVESGITARNTFPMPLLMKAPKAAAKIRRGLEKGRPLIAFPWQLYWTLWLLADLPRWLSDRLFGRLPKKS